MSKTGDKNTTKTSNADYPVDPAERASQQQRLRKAAAAGVGALKAPIPSLLSQLPPSPAVATPAQPAEPHTCLAPSASPTCGPNPAPASVPQIDPEGKVDARLPGASEDILAELRKISAWAETQRKITRWSFIFLALFVPALIGTGLWLEQRLQTNLDTPAQPRKPDWYEVDQNVRLGDFDKAIGIGEELILKTPQSPEAHQRLAGVYLAAGKSDKAREHYAEAFRLFPSEENEKRLAAIDKRIKSDQP